jgi:hypothetical protein
MLGGTHGNRQETYLVPVDFSKFSEIALDAAVKSDR